MAEPRSVVGSKCFQQIESESACCSRDFSQSELLLMMNESVDVSSTMMQLHLLHVQVSGNIQRTSATLIHGAALITFKRMFRKIIKMIQFELY